MRPPWDLRAFSARPPRRGVVQAKPAREQVPAVRHRSCSHCWRGRPAIRRQCLSALLLPGGDKYRGLPNEQSEQTRDAAERHAKVAKSLSKQTGLVRCEDRSRKPCDDTSKSESQHMRDQFLGGGRRWEVRGRFPGRLGSLWVATHSPSQHRRPVRQCLGHHTCPLHPLFCNRSTCCGLLTRKHKHDFFA